MGKTNESPEHEALVQMMLRYYEKEGYKVIQAAAEGYDAPVAIGRHEPDALVRQPDGLLRIFEAESGLDDFAEGTTTEQFQDFSNRVMAAGALKGQKVPFDVAVPHEKVTKLTQVLKELGIKDKEQGIGSHVEVWWPSNEAR